MPGRSRGPRLLSALAVAWLAVAALATPAAAHEDEQSVPALTQVQVAVTILRTQPKLVDLAADRINDATEAEDKDGVDIDRVEQAKSALEAGDMAKTELLLEQALGACPGQPVTNPAGVRAKLPQTACPAPPPMSSPWAASPSTAPPNRPCSPSVPCSPWADWC
jgi:hypothetical protein